MKHTYIFILAVGSLFLTSILSSCKHLDEKPDNLLTSDILWSNRANAESYLYNIYGAVRINGSLLTGAQYNRGLFFTLMVV
jgi:hypothetical protein